METLSEALRLKPDLALAWNARGFARYLMKRYAESLTDLNEAIRLNPRYLNAYQNRAAVRKALGDEAGAGSDRVASREATPNTAGTPQ